MKHQNIYRGLHANMYAGVKNPDEVVGSITQIANQPSPLNPYTVRSMVNTTDYRLDHLTALKKAMKTGKTNFDRLNNRKLAREYQANYEHLTSLINDKLKDLETPGELIHLPQQERDLEMVVNF